MVSAKAALFLCLPSLGGARRARSPPSNNDALFSRRTTACAALLSYIDFASYGAVMHCLFPLLELFRSSFLASSTPFVRAPPPLFLPGPCFIVPIPIKRRELSSFWSPYAALRTPPFPQVPRNVLARPLDSFSFSVLYRGRSLPCQLRTIIKKPDLYASPKSPPWTLPLVFAALDQDYPFQCFALCGRVCYPPPSLFNKYVDPSTISYSWRPALSLQSAGAELQPSHASLLEGFFLC